MRNELELVRKDLSDLKATMTVTIHAGCCPSMPCALAWTALHFRQAKASARWCVSSTTCLVC